MITEFPADKHIIWGYSRAAEGTMAIQGGWDNRLRYLQAQGLDPVKTVHAGLCHKTRTAVVTVADGGQVMPETDALITGEAKVGLAMTAADCLLVFGCDPVNNVIGLAHAGSRGLAKNILSEWLSTWMQTYPTNPDDLLISVSPSICPEHYVVDAKFAEYFAAWPDSMESRGEQIHLDLRRIARHQLAAAGVRTDHVTVSSECTFESAELFSYRRDHPTSSQLQVGYIMRQ